MICIYSKDNNEYTKNGDAVLTPISCFLQMNINGLWSLNIEHPYDNEERYKYIVEGAVIRVDLRCIRELTTIQQRFRIYQYTKNMHSISAIAFPVAMESTYDSPIDNLVISNKTGVEAMALLQAYTDKYTLSTDITAQRSTSFANTNINSAIASGDVDCFISKWGGEILYDNLKYSVKSSLGNNNSGIEIEYGKNLSAIERQIDDSGLTTRIKPISKDGIRLNGTGYVDSPLIDDYPIIHTRYMTMPYELVEDDVSSPSETAVASRTAQAAVNSEASTTSQSSYSTAIGAGYQPEYIKSIKDSIISAVQTMALSSVISTSLYNYLSKTIASAMSWMSELEQPAWDWMGSYETGWKYGNEDGYAVNQYVRIGKVWSYFGEDGVWQEPKDDKDSWDWHQVAGEEGRRYGNFTKYYAHNTYVYITMDGTLKKYWFDSDGIYDSDKTDDSDWQWNGSGTAADPWWFGDPDAEGDDKKYAHSTWLFIDGVYYFFDEFGYYDGSTKFDDYQWDWIESGENFWFGNPDEEFAATWVTSQWLKINGTWYYFDSDGYVISENASENAAKSIFTTGMASVKTVVDTQTTALYTVLYGLMTAYANKQYAEGVDVPKITITVDMVDLSKTTEYAGYAALETVNLGDSVSVNDDEHDISTSSRVIGLTYDCIRQYNSKVVIGTPESTVSEILGNAGGTAVAGGFDTSAIEAQLDALQNKVGEVFMNNTSIVTNGVARFELEAGDNMTMERSGNKIRFNSTASGGTGNVNLYHGINEPAASIGQNDDIYVKMKADPTSHKGLFTNLGGSGHSSINYYPDIQDYALNFWGTFYGASDPSWLYFICSHMPIEQGKKYRISFWLEPENTPQLSETNDLFGVTVQTTSSPLDVSSFASELVTNGEFQHITNHGDFYYQSFYNDGDSHHYTFDFEPNGTSLTNTAYFGIYFNRLSENLPVAFLGWTITELTEGTEVEEVYYKIEGSWRPYNGKNYLELINKPKINGVELTGNKSTSDLQIDYDDLIDKPTLAAVATTGDYNDLTGKPNIPDIVANGSGTASTDLTKLEVNSTIYNVQNLPLTVQNGKLCIIYDNGQ